MKFIIDKEKYIDSGLVTEKEHPEFPLLIYNYTPQCQFSRSWDEVTLMCRGLIVHKDTREIIARGFNKFFNYEEHMANGDKLPNEIPNVYAKMDGSLGIMYWWEGVPYIATRGSFTSDQALWATEYIRELGVTGGDNRYAHLFEIIYPENRIVVSYGNTKTLILLAMIEAESGRSVSIADHACWKFETAPSLKFTSYEELKALNTQNEEGFVLHYPRADMRVKIKFEDYVRLHKVMTGLSQIGIWEMLRDGIDPFKSDIPDEMYPWMREVVDKLEHDFFCIEEEASIAALAAKDKGDRKAQAEFITKTRYPGIAFQILDNKDYKTAIWRMVRPKGLSTFRKDIDA